MAVVLLVLFVVGAALGSFLNVLIYRLPHGFSILGRSYCTYCKRIITWRDNIPFVSFILLRGKCRYCRNLISWQYPLVELITGLLLAFTYWWFWTGSPLTFQFVYDLFIICVLIAVFFTDFTYGMIPDKITLPAIFISFVALFILSPNVIVSHLLAAAFASAFLLLLFLFTRGRGMGLGDVKLAFLLGLFLGFPTIIVGLYFAFLTGGVVSVLLLIKGIKRIGQTIAFGPFLVTGAIIAFFFGKTIIKMYGLMTLFS